MIRVRALREALETHRNDRIHGGDVRAGSLAFVRQVHDDLGVALDSRGRPTYHRDEEGKAYRAKGSARPDEYSLRYLAEAIMGHDFVEEYYHPSGGMDFSSRPLMEAAIDPSEFINISTYNLAVAGLVNAQILERFNQPEYLGDMLTTTVQTNKNGDKLIGVGRINPTDATTRSRKPGEAHAEIGFTEQYQTTPETIEQALKVKVTREAVFFDLTGQVLEEAGEVGDELGYQKEKDIANCVLGVTSSYNYMGTLYGTYQTSSPYVNDQVNAFSDWTSIDSARQLFIGMKDPSSGKEIRIQGLTALVMPAKFFLFRHTLNLTALYEGSNLTSGNNFPQRLSVGGNPLSGFNLKAIEASAIWYNRALAADGLNYSTSNAQGVYYIGDFKKAFEWRENWPITPWQASASELVMKDQGLIGVFGANHRGVANVRQPRYVVRNKAA